MNQSFHSKNLNRYHSLWLIHHLGAMLKLNITNPYLIYSKVRECENLPEIGNSPFNQSLNIRDHQNDCFHISYQLNEGHESYHKVKKKYYLHIYKILMWAPLMAQW